MEIVGTFESERELFLPEIDGQHGPVRRSVMFRQGLLAAISNPKALLFYGAFLLVPILTPAMQADFSACGGVIMLATGLRICGIKIFPIVNMLPALLLVMPVSALWARFFA